MAKIVAINGSPHESGNTASLLNAILDGAMGLSTNVIKYYDVWKIPFFDKKEFVLHCHDQVPPLADPLAKSLLDDMATADVLIFGTPVYFNMPTSQMQLLLEYMYCFLSEDFNVSKLKGKKAVIAVACRDINDNSLEAVKVIERGLLNFQMTIVRKVIYADSGGPLSADRAALSKAFEVGSKFSRSIDVEPIEEIIRLD